MQLRSKRCHLHNQAGPPAILPARYVVFGYLLALSACSVAQPEFGYTTQFADGAVRGYQIQVYSTQDRHRADAWVADAKSWWERLPASEQRNLFGLAYLPIEVKTQDPNFKVRIGHFRSREEARRVLEQLSAKFPAAFIVPDMLVKG